MLTGIIGDNMSIEDLKLKYVPSSAKRLKSPKDLEEEVKPSYNFVHYDPEMHWCKNCDIFPKTAKEYLNHLHSPSHKETCSVSNF